MSVSDTDAESVASSYFYQSLLDMDVFKRADDEGNFSSDSGHYSVDYYSQQQYDDHIYETIEEHPMGDYSKVSDPSAIPQRNGSCRHLQQNSVSAGMLHNFAATVSPPKLPPRNTKINVNQQNSKSKPAKGIYSSDRKSCATYRVNSFVCPSEVIDIGSNHVYTVADVLKTLADYVAHLPADEHFRDSDPAGTNVGLQTVFTPSERTADSTPTDLSDEAQVNTQTLELPVARRLDFTNCNNNSLDDSIYDHHNLRHNFNKLQTECVRMFGGIGGPSPRGCNTSISGLTSEDKCDFNTCIRTDLQDRSTSKQHEVDLQGARLPLGLLPEVFV